MGNHVSFVRGRLPLSLNIILAIYLRVEEILLRLRVREAAVFLIGPATHICLFYCLIFLKK
jgi:hypothetical protein